MSKTNKYEKYSRDELIDELETLKKKKYGLVWDKKNSQEMLDAFVNWENVPENFSPKQFPVLKEIKNKEIETDKSKPANILIEGDNYHSLAVLNFTHQNNIDVIYIDPPYNRGSNDFIFNDNYVDKEDPWRHSKWLTFMEKRLNLAKNLLKNDGLIFISIDDNEQAQLKLLCDEVFSNNFCGVFVWQKKYGGGNDSGQIANEHEYVLCYSKNPLQKEWLEPYTEDYLKRYSEEDELGRFFWDTLERPGLKNPIQVKVKFNGKIYTLQTFRSQKRVDEELKTGEIRCVNLGNKISFQFKQRLREGKKPRSILRDSKMDGDLDMAFLKIGSNSSAKKELKDIFHKDVFDNPKPTTLINYIIQVSGLKKGIVLDFFAGSGTTGHAVLKENPGIKFILCTNNENNICTDVTYPRLEKVIKGYENLDKQKIKGSGGNLKYFKTDFVGSDSTDKNKRDLVRKSAEMICIKEDIFDLASDGGLDYKIFQKDNKYLGIIFDLDAIAAFKKEAEKYKGNFTVYCFSYTETTPEHEFKSLKNKYVLKPIPAVILRIYLEIFKK